MSFDMVLAFGGKSDLSATGVPEIFRCLPKELTQFSTRVFVEARFALDPYADYLE